MDPRVGCLFLALLICCATADNADNYQPIKTDDRICQLCEQFAAEAFYYLAENETRAEIINSLHKACLKLPSFSSECISTIDHYADIFFKEVDSSDPKGFCKRIQLCDGASLIRLPFHDDACDLCREVVDDLRVKLNDPSTELDIVEVLLKACNNAKYHVQKCKLLIIEEGPVLVEHLKQILETKDVCRSVLACPIGNIKARSSSSGIAAA